MPKEQSPSHSTPYTDLSSTHYTVSGPLSLQKSRPNHASPLGLPVYQTKGTPEATLSSLKVLLVGYPYYPLSSSLFVSHKSPLSFLMAHRLTLYFAGTAHHKLLLSAHCMTLLRHAPPSQPDRVVAFRGWPSIRPTDAPIHSRELPAFTVPCCRLLKLRSIKSQSILPRPIYVKWKIKPGAIWAPQSSCLSELPKRESCGSG